MSHCREIEALCLGRLRHVRPLSECLCDGHYPVLQANDSNVCLTADPSSNLSKLRLADDIGVRFLAEYVNDGDLKTAWASHVRFNESATIQIDFRHLDQVSDTVFLQQCSTSSPETCSCNQPFILSKIPNLLTKSDSPKLYLKF